MHLGSYRQPSLYTLASRSHCDHLISVRSNSLSKNPKFSSSNISFPAVKLHSWDILHKCFGTNLGLPFLMKLHMLWLSWNLAVLWIAAAYTGCQVKCLFNSTERISLLHFAIVLSNSLLFLGPDSRRLFIFFNYCESPWREAPVPCSSFQWEKEVLWLSHALLFIAYRGGRVNYLFILQVLFYSCFHVTSPPVSIATSSTK